MAGFPRSSSYESSAALVASASRSAAASRTRRVAQSTRAVPDGQRGSTALAMSFSASVRASGTALFARAARVPTGSSRRYSRTGRLPGEPGQGLSPSAYWSST